MMVFFYLLLLLVLDLLYTWVLPDAPASRADVYQAAFFVAAIIVSKK